MPLGGFTVAIVGAYIAFLPLLQILLPLKAAAIDPGHATALLGRLAAWGALVAGVANIAVGWLSDRTRGRVGRRPWIVAGVIGVVAADMAIGQARTAPAALAAVAAFQIAFNILFSPLLALVPDHVTEARRGWASALIGLGKPIGTIVGTLVIGTLIGERARFLALAAMTLAAILPFAIGLRENRLAASIGEQTHPSRRWLSGNFVLAWLSRILVLIAFTVAQLYLLFYLEAIAPAASPRAIARGVTWLAVLFGLVSAATGIVAGRWSDRTRRRRPLVLASTIAIAAAMAALAAAPSWPIVAGAYALYAAGAGVHGAVEFAMIVDILPSRDRAARDLGILNISNIVPQIVAPLAVSWIVALPGSSIHWAFGGAAAATAAGTLLIVAMRGVR